MRCPSCRRFTSPHQNFGYCNKCYERAVKIHGELKLLVDSYPMFRPEKYVLEGTDHVYAHFHRVVLKQGLYLLKTDERQWCLEFWYEKGFPCPPTTRFVSPYNYDDDNPIFWPRMSIFVDSLRQVVDLPYLSPRSSAKAQVPEPEERAMKFWYPHRVVDALADKILPDILGE